MNKYVKILCDDQRFLRMLSLELYDIGIETVTDFEGLENDAEKYILADLDSIDISQLTDLSDSFQIYGYTRKGSAEIVEQTKYCNEILRRPFLTADLLSLFGHCEKFRRAIRIPEPAKRDVQQNKLTVDPENKNALWGDEVIPLSENEYKVLSLLCQNRGETVNRETIDMLLGADESNMGDVYVCHLRKKIDNKLGLKLIYTIRGKGYMLKN